MTTDIRHGYFSFEAAKRFGSSVFSKADGTGVVEVTDVFQTMEDAESKYLWHDKMYVGLVGEFLRKGYHPIPTMKRESFI